MAVRLVCATRDAEADFWARSPLGRSLAAIPARIRPELSITFDNGGAAARGLPAVYNAALGAAAADDVLVLVHDDVFLQDWFVVQRAEEAAAQWDVAGVAGALTPDLSQPSWYWTFDGELTRGRRQDGARSGVVAHGDPGEQRFDVFGAVPAPCVLLDGVLLVVNVGRVRSAGVGFDERFAFHLYDLDFCRSAGAAGLRLGTWPIAITHASAGTWGSDTFRAAATAYLEKWPASVGSAAVTSGRRRWRRR